MGIVLEICFDSSDYTKKKLADIQKKNTKQLDFCWLL